MEENILKVGKIFERWVTMDLSHKGMIDKMPSVSYIASSVISYPATKNMLESLPGDEMVRSIFVAYNLLSGDNDSTALDKSRRIYMIDIKQKDGEEYIPDIECEECSGWGEVQCPECDGSGVEDCGNCEGRGSVDCGDCDGDGTDEDGDTCYTCDGEGSEKCYDCDGDGSYSCSGCGGEGKLECPECDGGGEVEGSEEVVDIQYSTIITQDESLVEGIKLRLDNDDSESIDSLLNRFKGQIMITNVIDDTVDFYDEWDGESEIEYKLENIRLNHKGYKIGRDNKISAF